MKNFKAFSLIELLISLIIVSLVVSAFLPIATKKLNRKNLIYNTGANCNKFDEKCIVCSKDKCTMCTNFFNIEDGYYIDADSNNPCELRACSSKFGANCQRCTKDKCLSCDTGYKLQNNGMECSLVQCQKGYKKNGSSCIPCDGNTYQPNDNSVAENCISCQEGYVDNNYTTCKSCTSAYGANCTSCNASGCKSCNSPYQLISGLCKETQAAPGCAIANCSQCSSDGKNCETCAAGYKLDGTMCIEENVSTCEGIRYTTLVKGTYNNVSYKFCFTDWGAGSSGGLSVPSEYYTNTYKRASFATVPRCAKVSATSPYSDFSSKTVCNKLAAKNICESAGLTVATGTILHLLRDSSGSIISDSLFRKMHFCTLKQCPNISTCDGTDANCKPSFFWRDGSNSYDANYSKQGASWNQLEGVPGKYLINGQSDGEGNAHKGDMFEVRCTKML